jgi:hypothetical protein
MTKHSERTPDTPIEQRDPSTIRAVILARISTSGAKDEEIETQVESCKDFVTRMGWKLARDAYSFAEKKSGFRNVERPMLDEVLKLAQQGADRCHRCSGVRARCPREDAPLGCHQHSSGLRGGVPLCQPTAGRPTA